MPEGSSDTGALTMLGRSVKDIAEATREQHGFGAAKFVVFCNQPGDNPFMAGAIHGVEDADTVLNIGVSGPGVIARSLERLILSRDDKSLKLDEIAEEIKQTTFRVTRCGELVGRQVSEMLGIEFGVVDLSLAPTPTIGDSVCEILNILGVDAIGAPGSTAILGMINNKTTAARIIPVPGKEVGDTISFGGLFGASPIMEIRNVGKSRRFIGWGGRIPAPVHSFKN